LQKPIAKPAHGMSEYLPTNKDTNEQLQVYDALGIFVELEKPLVEHLEGFILLPREGGELQKNFRTLD
jgi:hypothetical protein